MTEEQPLGRPESAGGGAAARYRAFTEFRYTFAPRRLEVGEAGVHTNYLETRIGMQREKIVRSMDGPLQPARATEPALRLLVSIPALNEEGTVGEVIRGIPRDLAGISSVEVVVVDDGSDDRTAEVAAEAGALVIHHPRSRGVGAAFHSGLAHGIAIGADLIVSIDADGQFDPADIPALIAPVVRDEADFASASRFIDPALVPDMPRAKLWGNRVMSRLISRLAGEKFYDVSCGMRCYARNAALQLHLLGRFSYTQEAFLNLAFKQLRIVEVPIRVRGEREFGESRVANNLWRYGWRTAQIIFRSYRDYHPLRFFGGIALVLLVPALLLGTFVLVHYLQTGQFSPHKWAAFSTVGFSALSLLMAQIAVIGDMLTRHRVYLEELLYRQRAEPRSTPSPATSSALAADVRSTPSPATSADFAADLRESDDTD